MEETQWQELYIKAFRFAAQAHEGQTVPGTTLPYIMHLSFVGMEVIASFRAEQGRDESLAVQCALLHDVIEDTATTAGQLIDAFGPDVADGVLALTKDGKLQKDRQMADSLRRIREQPREVWMVKLADRVTNLQPPPSKWTQEKIQSYREEASLILQELGSASPFLAGRLQNKIRAYGT